MAVLLGENERLALIGSKRGRVGKWFSEPIQDPYKGLLGGSFGGVRLGCLRVRYFPCLEDGLDRCLATCGSPPLKRPMGLGFS